MWALFFILLVTLILFNVPIFIALLGVGLIFTLSVPDASLSIFAQQFISGTQSIPLLAIPFFIMAGVFMNYTGITRRLMDFCCAACSGIRGGLAQVNIVLSTMMGGLSGSNIADAAMMSKILVPEMEKNGFNRPFSSAVTASSALITPIIPPGIALIVYGFVGNVSIGRLFMAGIMPGLLCAVSLMVLAAYLAPKNGYIPPEESFKAKKVLSSAVDAFLALLMPVVIIGGIRFGIFTPTEAGAIAVGYAFFLGLIVYRETSWKDIKKGLIETLATTTSVVIIIAAAAAFSWILTWERVPHTIAELILTWIDNPFYFLLFINVLLLLIGMFIEGNAAMLVLVPILMPIVRQLGIDEVHFGIIVVFNMAIGTLTPPMGTIIFTTCSITKTDTLQFLKAMIPFYALLFGLLFLITYIPQISLFLPNWAFQ